MRCPRCGNENPESMRFCGMCGGALLSPAPTPMSKPERGVSPAPQPSAPATATATRPAASEQPRPTGGGSPAISGPSFLGLSDPPAARKRADLSVDAHHSGSRNLDYLLDDEEEHRGGGAGKFFLIVLALLLAVGFGYLRFKNQLPWITDVIKKPAPATQSSDQPPADSSTPASPSITPESQPAANPASNPPVANSPSSAQPAANPATSAPAPAAANPQPPAESNGTKPATSNAPETAATAKAQPDSAAATKTDEPAAQSEDSSDDNEPAAAPPEPKPKPAPPAAKPRAASKPVDSVAEAQKYLYGRGGVAQDCDRGLRLLKPLANQGNPKAMVEMGALYSAGLCAPHDLPTSYRWFAVALRKDPSNEAIQKDLQKLWGEMTQPERQLAIKLTQ